MTRSTTASLLLLPLLCFYLVGCTGNRDSEAQASNVAGATSDAGAVKAETVELPQVLIIGDSISIGYFAPTKSLLAGEAEVHHNPGNAQHTGHGLAHLDEWLGDTKWDVIHFNHGLHDLKYVNEKGQRVPPDQGTQQITVDAYRRNLDELTKRLKKTGAKLIFATTTPVPQGTGGRIQGDAQRYNEVALEIMKKHEVPVNDLYTFAIERLDAIQRPHNVHFTAEGSRQLAEQVAQHIRAALDER